VQQSFGFSFFNFPEIPMNQLVYSRIPAEQMSFPQLLKNAFKASALGIFIAAIRNER
jgi:hypothetical protein